MLRGGGRLALTCWSYPPSPALGLATEAIAAAGVASPEDVPVAPFRRHSSPEAFAALLDGAGFGGVTARMLSWEHRVDPREWWEKGTWRGWGQRGGDRAAGRRDRGTHQRGVRPAGRAVCGRGRPGRAVGRRRAGKRAAVTVRRLAGGSTPSCAPGAAGVDVAGDAAVTGRSRPGSACPPATPIRARRRLSIAASRPRKARAPRPCRRSRRAAGRARRHRPRRHARAARPVAVRPAARPAGRRARPRAGHSPQRPGHRRWRSAWLATASRSASRAERSPAGSFRGKERSARSGRLRTSVGRRRRRRRGAPVSVIEI